MINAAEKNRQIGETFGQALAVEFQKLRLVSVTVDRVDDSFAYCKIYEDNEPLPVPLKTLGLLDATITVYPNAGSIAVVGLIDGSGSTPVLVSCVEIDKIEIKRGKTELTLEITPPDRDSAGDPVIRETDDTITLNVDTSSIRVVKDLIEFNRGSLGGLVVVGDLTSRLNKLQSEIDQIQSAITSHTHGYLDSKGSAATPTPSTTNPATYTNVTLSSFKNADYENKKVKQ